MGKDCGLFTLYWYNFVFVIYAVKNPPSFFVRLFYIATASIFAVISELAMARYLFSNLLVGGYAHNGYLNIIFWPVVTPGHSYERRYWNINSFMGNTTHPRLASNVFESY